MLGYFLNKIMIDTIFSDKEKRQNMSETSKRIRKPPQKFKPWAEGEKHAPVSVRMKKMREKKKGKEKREKLKKNKEAKENKGENLVDVVAESSGGENKKTQKKK